MTNPIQLPVRSAVAERTCDRCGARYRPRRQSVRNRYCSAVCAQLAVREGLSSKRISVVPSGEFKQCTKCDRTLPIEDFPTRRDRGNRPRSHCRSCHSAYNKSARGRLTTAEWRYQVKYGLTVAEVEQMLAGQGSCCAICRTALTRETLNVDHDHVTGSVRALLCAPCNIALGLFRDSPARMEAAAAYVRVHTPHIGPIPIKK